jgi:hypothetical protein
MSKNIFRATAITLGGLALAAGAWTAVAAPRDTVPADTSVSTAVASDLAFSRDEERMARDLYSAIAAQYNNAVPFSTIVNSEQRHYASVGVLLVRYGVPDPSTGKAAGVYANADIQKLYDTLLAQSKVSLTEAYKVGVAVETRDIADVKDSMATATQADIDRVYGNLLNGSQMHLQAFTDATNGLVSTHVEDGTRGGMNRTTTGGSANATGMGTGVGNTNRGGNAMNRTQGTGAYGNGLGDGTCVTG